MHLGVEFRITYKAQRPIKMLPRPKSIFSSQSTGSSGHRSSRNFPPFFNLSNLIKRVSRLPGSVIAFSILLGTFFLFLFAYKVHGFNFLWNSDTAYFTFHKLSIIKKILSDPDALLLHNRFEGAGVPLFHAGSVDPMAFILLRWMEVLDFQITLAFFYVSLSSVSIYLLLKKINCSTYASLVGSLAWALNAFNLNYANEHVYGVFHVVVPFSLLVITHLSRKNANVFFWFPLFVMTSGLILLTGRWALVQYSFAFYVLWSIFCTPSWRNCAKLMTFLVAGLTLAFLLTGFFSLPYLTETISLTYRSSEFGSPKYVHWLRLLLDHLAPGLSHSPASIYTPLVLIPFAVIGYFSPSRFRSFCVITLLVFIFFSHPFGLFPLLQEFPLQAGNVVTIRFILFYYLGLSIAISVGFDHFFSYKARLPEAVQKLFYLSNWAITLLLGAILTVTLIFFVFGASTDRLHALALGAPPLNNSFLGPIKTLFGLSALTIFVTFIFGLFLTKHRVRIILYVVALLYIVNVLLLLLLIGHQPHLAFAHILSFCGFFIFLALIRHGPITSRRTVTFLCLLIYTSCFTLIFNAYMSDSRYDLMATRSQESESWTKAGKLLQAQTAPFRIAADHESIVRLALNGTNIEELGYFLPLPPKDLVGFFSQLNRIPAGPSPKVKNLPTPFFRLTNTRYYLLKAKAGGAKHVFNKSDEFRLFFADENLLIYEDLLSFPRFSFVTQYKVISHTKTVESLHKLTKTMDWFQNNVVLSEKLETPLELGESTHSQINVVHHSSGVYDISLDVGSDGLLVIADRYDENWRFKVNGASVSPLLANGFSIALPIKSGVSKIQGRYIVPSQQGLWLLGTAIFFSLFTSILWGVRRRYRNPLFSN